MARGKSCVIFLSSHYWSPSVFTENMVSRTLNIVFFLMSYKENQSCAKLKLYLHRKGVNSWPNLQLNTPKLWRAPYCNLKYYCFSAWLFIKSLWYKVYDRQRISPLWYHKKCMRNSVQNIRFTLRLQPSSPQFAFICILLARALMVVIPDKAVPLLNILGVSLLHLLGIRLLVGANMGMHA